MLNVFHFDFQFQIESEEAQRMSKRRLERERGRRDATADMSEDLSEGEKGDAIGDRSAHGDVTKGRMQRISSADAIEAWANQYKNKKLYIVLIRYEEICVRNIIFVCFTRHPFSSVVDYAFKNAYELGKWSDVCSVVFIPRY